MYRKEPVALRTLFETVGEHTIFRGLSIRFISVKRVIRVIKVIRVISVIRVMRVMRVKLLSGISGL
jgi:hypothetical protein